MNTFPTSLLRGAARRLPLALLLCAAALLACGNDAARPAAPTGPRTSGSVRLLFIGNSLTYYNDLGGMVRAVARSAGDDALSTTTVAFPDYALVDHMAEGTAPRLLRTQRWEYVIMQQGPSSLPESQLLLTDGARAFDRDIRAAGAEPVLYMVWPDVSRRFAFPAVLDAYRNAAAAVRGLFAPAGDAWTVTRELDAAIPLYQADGLHPTPFGTYLAALVILERTRGIDPRTLPGTIPGFDAVAESTVRTLQQAAATALARNPARPSASGVANPPVTPR